MTAIITSKKGVLSTETRPPTIIKAPIVIMEVLELYDDLLANHKILKQELEETNEKNIKLALSRKETNTKYIQLKNEYEQQKRQLVNYYNDLNELEFNLYCPEIKKELSIIDCNKGCKGKLCTPRYECLIRLEAIKFFFQIA